MKARSVVKAHRSITVYTDTDEWTVEVAEPVTKPTVFRFPDDSEDD